MSHLAATPLTDALLTSPQSLRDQKEGLRVRCVFPEGASPQPALLCCRPHFSQQLLILLFPETARWFPSLTPRCPGESLSHVSSPVLSHGPSPCPRAVPRLPIRPPAFLLPLSPHLRALPVARLARPLRPQALFPSPCPLFRTGQRKEGRALAAFTYFY